MHCKCNHKSASKSTHRHSKRQLLNRHTSPSGLVREPLRILLIHLLEMRHVVQEHLTRTNTISTLPATSSSPLHTNQQGSLTPTRTTFSISLPPASRIALMFWQHARVLSPMLPSTSLPVLSAGSWPETQIWPAALMAWE